MITKRAQYLLLASRYVQLLFGVCSCIANSAASNLSYYNTFLFTVAAAINGAVIITGVIGMFAYHRPRDVHWHLTLMFDVMAAVFSIVASLIDMIMSATWTYYDDYAAKVASISGCVLSIVLLIASIYAATKTRALYIQASENREGGDGKHDWFHMVRPEDRPSVLGGRPVGEVPDAAHIDRGYEGV